MYRDYITENVFEPLGLSHTAASLGESEEPNEIAEHDYLFQHFRINLIMLAFFTSALFAVGGLARAFLLYRCRKGNHKEL